MRSLVTTTLVWLALLLPAPISALHLETVEGTVEQVIITYPDKSETKTLVRDRHGHTRYLGYNHTLKTGDKVRARGRFGHSASAKADGIGGSVDKLADAPVFVSENIGPLRAVVIVMDYANDRIPYTREQVEAVIKPKFSSFFAENSDGQTSITPDVYGVYHLSVDRPTSFDQAVNLAIQAADPDVFFPAYNFVVVMAPIREGYSGIALLGRGILNSQDGQFRAGYCNNQLLGGIDFGVNVVLHEVGHNLGSHHSGTVLYSTPLVLPIGAMFAGTPCEYCNMMSTMGQANHAGQYDAAQKAFVGWLDGRVLDATTSGQYTIIPHDYPGAGPKLLRVRRGAGATGFVLFDGRTTVGNTVDAAWVQKFGGACYYDGANAFILDPTAGHWSPAKTMLFGAHPSDATMNGCRSNLKVGQTISDQATGNSYTLVSRTDTELTFDIIIASQPDTVSPTVSLIRPIPGSILTGTVPLEAGVTEQNLWVARLEARPPYRYLGFWTGPPFTDTWDSTELADGAGLLMRVEAIDRVGNYATTLFYRMTTDNETTTTVPTTLPPTTNPTTTTPTTTIPTTTLPPQDTTPPSVRITSPFNRQKVRRGSTISVQVQASDNVGVSGVVVTVDGSILCVDTSAPYACPWRVPTGRVRWYELAAQAWDAARNVGTSAPVRVRAN